MSGALSTENILELLRISAKDFVDSLRWELLESGELQFLSVCSDLFKFDDLYDAVEITDENFATLRSSVADVEGINGPTDDGFLLFCARVRGQRPRASLYQLFTVEEYVGGEEFGYYACNDEKTKALHALFDAAGPEHSIATVQAGEYVISAKDVVEYGNHVTLD